VKKDLIFHAFVASLLATGAVGAIVFLLLPGWSVLVRDVGLKGAWGVLIVFHLIYGVVIGFATFVFLKILEKYKSPGSVAGVGLSAAVTVTIVHIVTGSDAIQFGGFLLFSLWVVWLTWVINFVVFLSMKVFNNRFQRTF
jgi:hypothetical protein